jgi:dTDP-4-dehydrorhamnose reductase
VPDAGGGNRAAHSYGRPDLTDWVGERQGIVPPGRLGSLQPSGMGERNLVLDKKKEEQVVEEVLPALTSEFPAPADRPLYSALNCDRFLDTFGMRLPDWQEALRLAMDSARGHRIVI